MHLNRRIRLLTIVSLCLATRRYRNETQKSRCRMPAGQLVWNKAQAPKG